MLWNMHRERNSEEDLVIFLGRRKFLKVTGLIPF